jgi:hypothetical protein
MTRLATIVVAGVVCSTTIAFAHDGPPYPIVTDRVAGAYRVAVWTDPDTTDDGSAGGQFWVRLERAAGTEPLPPSTRARVAVRALDRAGLEVQATAEPVRGDVTNQFAGLVMDHEGRFAVRVIVDGPLGTAAIDAEVEATYDTRPPPILLLVYLAPFVLVGLLWARLLVRRRAAASVRRRSLLATIGGDGPRRRRPDLGRSGGFCQDPSGPERSIGSRAQSYLRLYCTVTLMSVSVSSPLRSVGRNSH